MSRLSAPDPGTSPGDSAPRPGPGAAGNETERNGSGGAVVPAAPAAASPEPTDEGQAGNPRVKQAEQWADHFAGNVSWLVSLTGQKLRLLAARTREAVSDFWAEVQNVRRGEK